MTFALIAASAVLLGPGQPKSPDLVIGTKCDRLVQWTMIPGGAVVPMPMPYLVMVSLEKAKLSQAKERAKLEWTISFDAERDDPETFAKMLIEQVQGTLHELDKLEAFKKSCPTTKTDPLQVIDPVVTGF